MGPALWRKASPARARPYSLVHAWHAVGARPERPSVSPGFARAAYPESRMAIADQIKTDLQGAMRAGEKQRVGALRLVLSELQKAAKEGGDDELAVLRRERKRRLEAARADRGAGREGLARGAEAWGRVVGRGPATGGSRAQ